MDKLQELTRKLHNLIRYATVAAVKGHSCQVTAGGLTSAWLPWLTQRAGNDVTWWAPSVGEQVLWLAPGGLPTTGIVLPGIYSNQTPAPSTDQAVHATHYRDGAVISYDTANHTLHAKVPGDADITTSGDLAASVGGACSLTAQNNITAISAAGDISVAATAGGITAQAATNITATAPTIALTGAVTITGSLTLAGPFAAGPGGSGGGGMALTGDLTTIGTITNNGVPVDSTHVHPGVKAGPSSTGTPA